MREHRAGLEKGNANADTAEIGGRLPGHTEQARVREQEDVKSDDCGVLVRRGSGDGMGAEESRRNTGSPRKQSIKAQRGIPRGTGLACVGGGEARSSEDTRNERRAKGPQFQGNATSGARAEIGASLPPAEKLLKLQETLHAKSMKTPWSESRMRETRTSGLMSGGVETGPLKDTAPPLDSTRFLLNGWNLLGNKELWDSAKNSLFLRCCSAETSKRQAREAALSLRSAWSRAPARSRRGSRSVLPRIASRICETSGLVAASPFEAFEPRPHKGRTRCCADSSARDFLASLRATDCAGLAPAQSANPTRLY